jgi:hypothetical protein
VHPAGTMVFWTVQSLLHSVRGGLASLHHGHQGPLLRFNFWTLFCLFWTFTCDLFHAGASLQSPRTRSQTVLGTFRTRLHSSVPQLCLFLPHPLHSRLPSFTGLFLLGKRLPAAPLWFCSFLAHLVTFCNQHPSACRTATEWLFQPRLE